MGQLVVNRYAQIQTQGHSGLHGNTKVHQIFSSGSGPLLLNQLKISVKKDQVNTVLS